MPEGPEVRTIAKTLKAELVGHSLGCVWQSGMRFRKSCPLDELKMLEGTTIDDVSSYGKVLFIESAQKPIVSAQLGMTGQLTIARQDAPVAKHTHLRWELNKSPFEIRYVDPRRFGLIDYCNEKKHSEILARLGPDPFLLKKPDYQKLIARMRASAREIKAVLLDQNVLVGVGNIYASESLFLSRIHPKTRALDISEAKYYALIDAVIEVLEMAYNNGGTTFSDFVDGTGKKGRNINYLQVFMRSGQPCHTCGHKIQSIKQSGRSSFFCAKCQEL